MKKLTPSQRAVLSHLIFTESYENLLSDSGFHRGALRDDLIQLINSGMIEVFDRESQVRLHGYDSDNLQYFSFRATKKGLENRA
ncbi:MAG: hypothetical protein LAT67_03830 [Balneolales bacterium]|nr:hypothetical protein [Balneolales bacterium]